jgi:hypothetical protein
VLLVAAYFYIKILYNNQMQNWISEITVAKVVYYGFPILVKSIIALSLIILIHNNVHYDRIIEFTSFVFVFLLFAIYQSSFSISGFFGRNKYVYATFIEHTMISSKRLMNRIRNYDISFSKSVWVIKVLIVFGFLFFVVQNISIFVAVNLIFLIIILFMILFALLQNNFIYFGLVSLVIFQFNTMPITLTNIPYGILALSFVVIVIGATIETRLQRRMFILIKALPIKRLNFKLGYDLILDKKSIVVYQNMINKYYYIYYRKIGVVVVYHSLYDPKISYIVINKMIRYGKMYLSTNNID